MEILQSCTKPSMSPIIKCLKLRIWKCCYISHSMRPSDAYMPQLLQPYTKPSMWPRCNGLPESGMNACPMSAVPAKMKACERMKYFGVKRSNKTDCCRENAIPAWGEKEVITVRLHSIADLQRSPKRKCHFDELCVTGVNGCRLWVTSLAVIGKQIVKMVTCPFQYMAPTSRGIKINSSISKIELFWYRIVIYLFWYRTAEVSVIEI